MATLIWRVKLAAEMETAVIFETEVARGEGNDYAAPETFGLTLPEGNQLTAAASADGAPRTTM